MWQMSKCRTDIPQGPRPNWFQVFCGTAEVVPNYKAVPHGVFLARERKAAPQVAVAGSTR